MPGLDSGYNSRNFHVCIFDCAVDSYLAFSVDSVFYTRHSASPRRSHYYAYMQAARYSVRQTEHSDFGNHDPTSRRSQWQLAIADGSRLLKVVGSIAVQFSARVRKLVTPDGV